MNCDLGGKDLSPKIGFWMNPYGVLENPDSVPMHDAAITLRSDRRLAVVPEPIAFRCAQGACLSNWTCQKGHDGRLCGLCQELSSEGKRFAMGADGCVECDESEKDVGISITVVVGLVLLLAYYLAVWRPLLKSDKAEKACISTVKGTRHSR